MVVKATGIVRRIDDLGRVVIPKELRRALRLREGDPIEMFLDKDGTLILKKYSPIGELSDFAKEYADSLHEATGDVVLITDRDNIIAISGVPKKRFLNKPIWASAIKSMNEYKTVLESGSIKLEEVEGYVFNSQVIAPIICEGDVLGVVGLISEKENMGIVEKKLAETAAGFLAKQMES